jgi:hypothetical protein
MVAAVKAHLIRANYCPLAGMPRRLYPGQPQLVAKLGNMAMLAGKSGTLNGRLSLIAFLRGMPGRRGCGRKMQE